MTGLPAASLAVAAGVVLGVGGYTFWYGGGHAYLSDDPRACVNCHIMQESYDTWRVSSHRGATCNDCHLPEAGPGKYAAKVENGFRHSWAFTFQDVQVLRITRGNLENLQGNCVRCHAALVWMIRPHELDAPAACTRCHRGVGHGL